MIAKLRTWWAGFRAWLAGQFMEEPPSVKFPYDEEYHTMEDDEPDDKPDDKP